MCGTNIIGSDGKKRCKWCEITPEFIHYHDSEWGFPVKDDFKLFEKLCLESFQSGLSWRTILSKRENFREAFHDFNFNLIADFTEIEINALLNNQGIVRHRGKIEAVINNAKRAKEIVEQKGSLAAYLWSFEPQNETTYESQSISTSPESVTLAKDLKKRGWKFIGPTTVYAFMQAMGLINDHSKGCIIREKVTIARKKFVPPRVKSI